MPHVLVLNHHALTGPSAFVPVLDRHAADVPWRQLEVPDGDALPDTFDDVAGMVVMGGPQSAVQPDEYPWMPPELDLLRRAVDAEVPVFGVCLGSQLLGRALGGHVGRRALPEVGLIPLRRTDAGRSDPVFGAWRDDAPALLLHEDQVLDLPPGAEPVLTGSDGTPAWRWGSAHAVQFHPEVPVEQLAGWLQLDGIAAQVDAVGMTPGEVLELARAHEQTVLHHGEVLLTSWLERLPA